MESNVVSKEKSCLKRENQHERTVQRACLFTIVCDLDWGNKLTVPHCRQHPRNCRKVRTSS